MGIVEHKDTRIDLRIESSQKDLLMYAALLCKMKLSAFVLDSAFKAAEKIIADKVYFSLPKKQWDTFCSALDKPAREISRLKQLLTKPSIFDEK